MKISTSVQHKINRLLEINMERRQFLTRVAGAAALSVLPIYSCSEQENKNLSRFTPEQKSQLISIQEHLLPHEEHAPGAMDVHAADYLESALNQPGFDPEITDFIISGLDHILKYTDEEFDQPFIQLNIHERENVLKKVQEESWGSSWISLILSYLLEALLSDPIYGGNTNQIGWKWLEHTPGVPRPDESTRYAAHTKV